MYRYSTEVFHLEKRLPIDRVQGNITLTIQHELDLGQTEAEDSEL